jgi:hypothetical protein
MSDSAFEFIFDFAVIFERITVERLINIDSTETNIFIIDVANLLNIITNK